MQINRCIHLANPLPACDGPRRVCCRQGRGNRLVIGSVVVGAQAGQAFALAAVGQRSPVGLAHGGVIGGSQGRHLPVAGVVGLTIERVADQRQGWPRPYLCQPAQG